MVTPEEVAERYNVAVDWKNIGGSKGLTTQQVGTHVTVPAPADNSDVCWVFEVPDTSAATHCLLPYCRTGQGAAGQAWVSASAGFSVFSTCAQ